MSQPHELRAYEYVNRPYEAVRDALRADAGGIFGRATTGAATRAGSVAASLRAKIGSLEVGTDVTIEIGAIEEVAAGPLHNATMKIPLSWKATRAPGLFPSMEAVLSVYALSKDETQLDLRGLYRPPLGALGAAVDSIALSRLADASVHRFVADIAAKLSEDLAK